MTDTEFFPFASLAGGMLIGFSAVIMMMVEGRIVGISGFLSRLLPPYTDAHLPFRAAFICGLIASTALYKAVTGSLPIQGISSDIRLLSAAGLLVGLGTVIGNGCTSGHGVCGIARLSRRSLVATLVFFLVAMATVFITHHRIWPS